MKYVTYAKNAFSTFKKNQILAIYRTTKTAEKMVKLGKGDVGYKIFEDDVKIKRNEDINYYMDDLPICMKCGKDYDYIKENNIEGFKFVRVGVLMYCDACRGAN